jgi:hypothetical protein
MADDCWGYFSAIQDRLVSLVWSVKLVFNLLGMIISKSFAF